jgi:hypothetical protein
MRQTSSLYVSGRQPSSKGLLVIQIHSTTKSDTRTHMRCCTLANAAFASAASILSSQHAGAIGLQLARPSADDFVVLCVGLANYVSDLCRHLALNTLHCSTRCIRQAHVASSQILAGLALLFWCAFVWYTIVPLYAIHCIVYNYTIW